METRSMSKKLRAACDATEATAPTGATEPSTFPEGAPLATAQTRPPSRTSSKTSSRHSTPLLAARRLALEAEFARESALAQAQVVETQRKAAEIQLRANLAALDAEAADDADRHSNTGSVLTQWLGSVVSQYGAQPQHICTRAIHNVSIDENLVTAETRSVPATRPAPSPLAAQPLLSPASIARVAPVVDIPASDTIQATHFVNKDSQFQYPIHANNANERAGMSDICKLTNAIMSLSQNKQKRWETKLPIFDGRIPAEFLSLKRIFDDTQDSYTAAENIARLSHVLRGEARETVAVLLVSAQSPKEVMDALEMRYGRAELIVLQQLANMRALPRIGFEGKDLNLFACRVRNAVETIKLLKQECYLESPELVNSLLGKLTHILRSKWTDYAAIHYDQFYRLELFSKFLTHEADIQIKFGYISEHPLEPKMQNFTSNSMSRNKHRDNVNSASITNITKRSCPLCKQTHKLADCVEFQRLDIDDRWQRIKSLKVCYRCLKNTPHTFRTCNPKIFCMVNGCILRHHKLLHQDTNAQAPNTDNTLQSANPNFDVTVMAQNDTNSPVNDEQSQFVGTTNSMDSSQPYLKIIPVTVTGPQGSIDTFALLDDGSTATLIDSSLTEKIGAVGRHSTVNLHCVGGLTKQMSVQYIQLDIKGRFNNVAHRIHNVRSIDNIGMAAQTISQRSIGSCAHLHDIAHELCYEYAIPKIIIGVDNWNLIVAHEVRRGTRVQPVAIKTSLGWVLFGCASSRTTPIDFINHCSARFDFDREFIVNLIREQYKIESIGITRRVPRSEADNRALEILNITTRRLSSGRFETGLLWRADKQFIPNSYDSAFSRFRSLERKMAKDSNYADLYRKNIQAMFDKGYAEECRENATSSLSSVTWYLPHFGVTHAHKPDKLRIVHDAAAKFRKVFANASELAFAAVAYWRFILPSGEIQLALIGSKARVAPLKPVTIPRLELQGAILASRLAITIDEAHRGKSTSRVFWCDSLTVLGWLRNDARNFKPFVAHRVGEILESCNVSEWRWVPSGLNVADDITRAKPGNLKQDSRWFCGPEFLLFSKDKWPTEPSTDNTLGTQELKAVHVHLQNVVTSPFLPLAADTTRFSSWLRMVRSTARAHQYLRILRERCSQRRGISPQHVVWTPGFICSFTLSPNHQTSCSFLTSALNAHTFRPFTARNLYLSKVHILRHCQQSTFIEDLGCLRSKQPIPSNSKLKLLTPVIDELGLLRAKGRIATAQGIDDLCKNPIILDGRHATTRLLITDSHERTAHGNHQTNLNELRQTYWILRLRTTVRNISRNCQFCRVHKSRPTFPSMGDLPVDRLAHHERAFTHVGLDYFGPIQVTIGRRTEKRYVALFTCLTVRAVHLDVVDSLSADSALMTIRRFIARRGAPRRIISDNGTAFVGADRVLRELYQRQVSDLLANKGIEWSFIPPSSPFMGGAWERLIRSVKTSLAVVLKERRPKEEIFRTLLTEVEAIVNSRPLTHVSVDIDEHEALTPFHFLIGTSSTEVMPIVLDDGDLSRRCDWKKALRLADHFWTSWVKEYLPTLVPRRYSVPSRNLAVGDLVFVCDGTLPRGLWPRGRITRTFPGRDGIVRVLDVRTQNGTLRRPAKKLVPLLPASTSP